MSCTNFLHDSMSVANPHVHLDQRVCESYVVTTLLQHYPFSVAFIVYLIAYSLQLF